ncbi:MAG: TadE/TadG family type IV pilus assembly protein, partial [Pseudomonadota bacterium]
MFRRFLQDDRGTITVEFVLIFPILALWLGASFIFFDAFKTTSQAAKAAYTIADMVSRQPVVPNSYIDEMHLLQEKLLPRTPPGKWLRMTSIQYIEDPDNDGDGLPDATYHKVLWSRAKPLVADQDGNTNEMQDADIPTEIIPTMSANDTVVLVENFVPYSSIPIPLLNQLNFTGLEWRNRIPVRPRFSSQVVLNGNPYSPAPPVQVAAVDPAPTTTETVSGSDTSSNSPSFQETN